MSVPIILLAKNRYEFLKYKFWYVTISICSSCSKILSTLEKTTEFYKVNNNNDDNLILSIEIICGKWINSKTWR